jgi:hypothetical protein
MVARRGGEKNEEEIKTHVYSCEYNKEQKCSFDRIVLLTLFQ